MTFNVGDYIVMKQRGNHYAYTKYKSTGVVLEVEGDQVHVEFDHMTGDVPAYETENKFWVDAGFCKLAKKLTQQERVCAKIKQMEARWIKFQSSKKDHYYV